MTNGQKTGKLIGHLSNVVGAGLLLWACIRFVVWGNAPDIAVGTVDWFIFGSALQVVGDALVWFAGGSDK